MLDTHAVARSPTPSSRRPRPTPLRTRSVWPPRTATKSRPQFKAGLAEVHTEIAEVRTGDCCPRYGQGWSLMNIIIKSLLNEFSAEQELGRLPEDQRFEHFAAFVTVKRQHRDTFSTSDVVTGSGGDSGIDGFAAIVNGTLVPDIDELEDIASTSGHLDVTLVFVQAQRSAAFNSSKIGTFGFGVGDFLSKRTRLKRNKRIGELAALTQAIYSHSTKFKRGLPACKLYYVTTGKWEDDPDLVARKDAVIADLEKLQLLGQVDFFPIDANGIRELYQQAKNAIRREFEFVNKAVVPPIANVTEAYIGILPVNELLKILTDDDGDITKSVFYDNVRDWQGDNDVNREIQSTLRSDHSTRFALMNNGVTIIARELGKVGNAFSIEDFQIVNGCQSCHVLFEAARDNTLNSSIMVPLRLIVTQDEDVINGIIRATNRQTEVKDEQFFALTEFPKQLESYFSAFSDSTKRLYYERRSRQYDSQSVEKTRVVTQANLARSFSAMFLGDPHTVARSAKTIRGKLGDEIFAENHQLIPYYVAAFALYKLEYLFRSRKVDPKYKPGRYHLLYAVRLLANAGPLPPMNANAMETYCSRMTDILWDQEGSDIVFKPCGGSDRRRGGRTGVLSGCN